MALSIVVTGVGAVSPCGTGAEIFWRDLVAGNCALRPVTRFDASPYRNNLGGEVPGFDDAPDRAVAFAVAAATEAVRDAGITLAGIRLGICVGTNFSGIEQAEKSFRTLNENPAGAVSLTRYAGEYVIRRIREQIPSAGPEAVLSLSCASGAAAIGTALEWLRAGRADAVIAGGFDELSESAFAGLSALRAISKDTIRPFAKTRGGTIFSEGAGILLLETEEAARERGAKIRARLLGRGVNNDAFHMTAPEKTGSGIAAVMRMALADAKVSPGKIIHLNCHATGTAYNDMIETAAVKNVFGQHAYEMVLTASKSVIGHAMGAAGALEAVATCLAVESGIVPPTINCDERDPELDLDYCFDKKCEREIPFAMTNSYGLGGTNASLVFAKCE
jgi:3-oxoacyl-(acyl-carrier-protein) synthase